MNRIILTVVGLFGASSLLLVDSAVKGTALLLLAAVAAIMLRRDSAATRHVVWLVAIVAILVVPVLSAMLPQWRVMPEWAGISPKPVVVNSSMPSIARPAEGAADLPQVEKPVTDERPSATAREPATALPALRPAFVTPRTIPGSAVRNWNWINALPLVWAIGFSVLILRLMAARLLLWNCERQGTVIGSSRQPATATRDPILTALKAVCSQLGIIRPVTLLVHPDKTIPVVWGILRCSLLLPAAARHWSGEQLRSVLLHELAHIKRRDTTAQLLTQIACALHWFNPLVWLAAWRLGVERERACDDLVLASGVRPSAYAGHLLDVVTGLSPARWTHACGLAMARKSSLEGRLVAVLSKNLNRRGLSVALAAIALAIAVGIAVPIAMLRAADEKPAKKAEVRPNSSVTDKKPRHEYAQSLFIKWQLNARTDGKIPGALVGRLAGEVDNFLKQYPREEMAKKLALLRPRLDASHDWAQPDAVALLDDITALSTAPVSWADLSMDFDDMRNFKAGQPLPFELKTAAWGAPAPNGLRAAWLLEPRAQQYPLGSVLKARVLFHNTGKEPVVFKIETWRQFDSHTARDAKGGEIKVSSTHYSGITPTATYRLAPDEYCEVMGHGIAIGAGKYEEEFSSGSVGAVIEAKEGDDVRLSHVVSTSDGGWTRPDDPKDPAELREMAIAERISRESPMPQAAADREQLIRRVTLDLFGVPATAEETASFVSDNDRDALANLTARLQAKPRIEPFSGKLATGETRFRVTAPDPNAARGVRAASSPGRYVLGENQRLQITQITTDARRTNKATILFFAPDPKAPSPHDPYEIALPDGLGTYGIAWERGAGVLWVMQKGLVRKYDFTNPAQVKESRFHPGSIDDVPGPLRGALRQVFAASGMPVQQQDSQKPKGAAKLDPKTEEKLKWGEVVNGLRAALVIRTLPDESNAGGTPDIYLLVQNVSDAPIHFSDTAAGPELRYLTLYHDDVPQSRIAIDEPTQTDVVLEPRAFTFLQMVPHRSSRGQRLAAIMLKEPHEILLGQIKIEKAPAGAWTGTLVSSSTNAAGAQIDPPEAPKAPDAPDGTKSQPDVEEKPKAAAQSPKLADRVYAKSGVPLGAAKLQPATEAKLEWGEPVNGLRMALAWPPALGEPAAGDVADFYLAVQNASKTAVRLCTTVDAPHERWLDIKEKDRIVSRIGSKEPNGVDVTLQPQEVAFLRLFQEAVKDPNGASAGAAIASDIRQSTRYQLNGALKVDKAPAGAWTGTVTTPNTRAGVGAEAPKNRKAQELLKVWLHDARLSGKIPGGFIARLGEHMKAFVKGNAADAAGAPFAKRLEPLLPRLDGSRDWQPVDAAALLNDIAAVSDAPLSVMLEEIVGGKVQYGLPLPPELEKAPWGEPVGHGVGLRTATIVGPGIESKLQYVDWIGGVVTEGRAAADKAAVNAAGAEIRLGTPLGCRILVHNAGKEPVVFRTRTWHHIEPTAKDAKGAEIGMESVSRFTRAPLVTFRLEPGRYIELASPGFGLGKYGFHDFKNADIASWIGAKEGDDVSLTPGVLPLLDWNEERTLLLDGEPRWWLDFIAARLSLVTPLPTDAAERRALLRRVMWDIYLQGTDPTEEESAAFVSDTSTQALTKLAERLFHRTGVRVWAGPLQSGPTKFRVLPADPKAPKPPEGPAPAPAPASPAAPDKPAAAPADDKPKTSDLPKDKEGQALFKKWQEHARGNGNIPGGLVGRLGEKMKEFISLNTGDAVGDPYAKKMERLVPRCDATRDWTPAEIVALMDDITAITPIPLVTMMDETAERTLKAGSPLPPSLANAPWGEATSEGLRMAWLFEPRAAEYRLGTPLKSRILLHNSGKNAVVFRTRTLHQVGHTARDANGADIKVSSVSWTAVGQFAAFRLEPGEFVEVTGPGIGVGAMGNAEDWQNARVGSWVEAKQGDDVTLTTAPILVSNTLLSGPVSEADWKKARTQEDEPDWWLGFITARLSRELPLPASAEERTRLLNRAVRDLFGAAPTAEETAAFLADGGPNALDSLAKRLEHRPGLTTFSGKMTSGPTKFRVIRRSNAS